MKKYSLIAATCVAGSGYMPRGCSLKLAMPVQILKLVFDLISSFLCICEVICNNICWKRRPFLVIGCVDIYARSLTAMYTINFEIQLSTRMVLWHWDHNVSIHHIRSVPSSEWEAHQNSTYASLKDVRLCMWVVGSTLVNVTTIYFPNTSRNHHLSWSPDTHQSYCVMF